MRAHELVRANECLRQNSLSMSQVPRIWRCVEPLELFINQQPESCLKTCLSAGCCSDNSDSMDIADNAFLLGCTCDCQMNLVRRASCLRVQTPVRQPLDQLQLRPDIGICSIKAFAHKDELSGRSTSHGVSQWSTPEELVVCTRRCTRRLQPARSWAIR